MISTIHLRIESGSFFSFLLCSMHLHQIPFQTPFMIRVWSCSFSSNQKSNLDLNNFYARFFIHLQGFGSSQLADYLVNEINQGPCYVKNIKGGLTIANLPQIWPSIWYSCYTKCNFELEEQDFRYIFQDASQQTYHSSIAEIPGNLARQKIKKLNLFFIVHRTVFLLCT